jgi:hypothetical protein
MTQPKDFSPIRPSVWGLTTTWPLLQRLCEEDPQARGLLDVVVTLRIIPHGIVKLTQIIVRLCSKERTIKARSICYSREADRSTSRCSRTERARFRALRSSVS